MKLKDKFSILLPFYNVNDNNNKSIQCEKIADEYAIEFAEWLMDGHVSELTLKEFKKQKEL